MNETITSFKQVYSITKQKALKWDKRARCVSIMAKFNSPQDVEMLNVEIISNSIFRGTKFNGIEDGDLDITFHYNSNIISEIFGIKGVDYLMINPKAREIKDILDYNIDISDIPQLTTYIFGENWKNDYADWWLKVTVFDDSWCFVMRNENTGKEIYKYINPYNKQILANCMVSKAD